MDVLVMPGKRELLEEGKTNTTFVSKSLSGMPAEAMRCALLAGRMCWYTPAEALLQPRASSLLYQDEDACTPGFAPATETPWPSHLVYIG